MGWVGGDPRRVRQWRARVLRVLVVSMLGVAPSVLAVAAPAADLAAWPGLAADRSPGAGSEADFVGGAVSGRHAVQLQVTTSPALFPRFARDVPGYVVHCVAGRPVRVSVSVPPGTEVTLDGHRIRGRSATAHVSLSSGQAFVVDVTARRYVADYEVRCLPSDFPRWTVRRFERPQASFYVVAPCCADEYAAIFDTHGVPIWWLRTTRRVLDAALLPDGDVQVALDLGLRWGYGLSDAEFEEYRLNGVLERTLSIPHAIPNDRHEVLVLANGDYIALAHTVRSGVDLSPYGGPRDALVLDAYIAEVSPRHKLLWSWNSGSHIGRAETGRWYKQEVLPHPARLPGGTLAYDIVHINSVAPYGRGFLVSLRHTDAIYYIDKATGHVIWKLGGTPTPKSLKIIGDSVPDFGGQHDVQALPDGTITLLDNGTGRDRPPRALRFHIDEQARTATLIEDLSDNLTPPASPCCGSARRLPGGDWVVSWGGQDVVSELTHSDAPVFVLEFPGESSFRALPVLPGQLSRRALNAAMDHRVPRAK